MVVLYLQGSWLPRLRQVVDHVNEAFSQSFAQVSWWEEERGDGVGLCILVTSGFLLTVGGKETAGVGPQEWRGSACLE